MNTVSNLNAIHMWTKHTKLLIAGRDSNIPFVVSNPVDRTENVLEVSLDALDRQMVDHESEELEHTRQRRRPQDLK
jgi:hypothetical protein